MLGGAKPPISDLGRDPKSREWIAASSLPTSWGRGWGSAVSSPSGVRGGALAAERFSCILQAPDSLSWNLLMGVNFGGGRSWPFAPLPLNPPMNEAANPDCNLMRFCAAVQPLTSLQLTYAGYIRRRAVSRR